MNKYAQTVQNFGQTEAKNMGVEYLGEASWRHVDSKYAKWVISFVDRDAAEINMGRQKIVRLIDDFWSELQSNDIFHEYFEREYPKARTIPTHPLYNTSTVTLDENSMGIRLAYWDENTDRRTYPYLAQIRVADSKIYYYYANTKTQKLGRPIIETFEEARQKVKESKKN